MIGTWFLLKLISKNISKINVDKDKFTKLTKGFVRSLNIKNGLSQPLWNAFKRTSYAS